MISLNIKPLTKSVQVNGKTVQVPKLGLKHYGLIKEIRSKSENMKRLMDSIQKGLTVAERDIVTLHLFEFNTEMPNKCFVNDQEITLDDVYVCQKLKFTYQDKVFKFKSYHGDQIDVVPELLQSCLVSVKDSNGNELDHPNFMDMPAFVVNWAEQILQTIAVDTPNGTVRGLNDIMELFNGTTKS
ncbi:gp28 baseplate hub distal subunit [Acinetobacter phage Ac42]|uniref:baseplate hub distal subunit n=1 Tax=Acinetobacter phage Ac42 TaxID=762660 RepID=UPI0001EBCDBE|nr:baseplate hub distal subunit [Acinetobacter phage Ac42]ADI96434.1 gp28 baseplate hub distal subunit [Acinetobacter phage Ac42]